MGIGKQESKFDHDADDALRNVDEEEQRQEEDVEQEQ
jgi:hypothetical protein